MEPIFSSRVNDGICGMRMRDRKSKIKQFYSDCCDGGDEYEYKMQCVNTCEELGAQLRKQQQEEKEKLERVFIHSFHPYSYFYLLQKRDCKLEINGLRTPRKH